MNRRAFLSTLGTAGVAAALRPRLTGAPAAPAARVALVGCGWYGVRTLENFLRNEAVEVAALCDPNAHARQAALALTARYQAKVPRVFADYREMFAAGPLEVVIVSTPDHWHTLPALAAMQAGADVYLEKPVSHDVIEGEALVAAARKYGRVVQVNTQRRSTPHFLTARDKYLRSGRLGPIGAVEIYSYLHGRMAEVVPDEPPPAHLDYDLWLGPAPRTPFKAVKEVRGWRNFRDYGNGQIGDLGVHMLDAARWLLGLGWPEAISATGGILVDRASSADIPDTERAVFRYPGLDVTWLHRTWGVSPIPERHWTDQWGLRLLGRDGTLNLTLLGYEFTPAAGGPREGLNLLSRTGDLENVDLNNPLDFVAEAERRHARDFMAARATRGRPVADLADGHISTACCVLANLALDLGRPVAYDPASRTVPGDPEATRRLRRPYRAPWVHPEPADV